MSTSRIGATLSARGVQINGRSTNTLKLDEAIQCILPFFDPQDLYQSRKSDVEERFTTYDINALEKLDKSITFAKQHYGIQAYIGILPLCTGSIEGSDERRLISAEVYVKFGRSALYTLATMRNEQIKSILLDTNLNSRLPLQNALEFLCVFFDPEDQNNQQGMMASRFSVDSDCMSRMNDYLFAAFREYNIEATFKFFPTESTHFYHADIQIERSAFHVLAAAMKKIQSENSTMSDNNRYYSKHSQVAFSLVASFCIRNSAEKDAEHPSSMRMSCFPSSR